MARRLVKYDGCYHLLGKREYAEYQDRKRQIGIVDIDDEKFIQKTLISKILRKRLFSVYKRLCSACDWIEMEYYHANEIVQLDDVDDVKNAIKEAYSSLFKCSCKEKVDEIYDPVD
ncbi:MAG: hypothetical protein E7374_01755 [Clostridiales bacterium]|nr:hypothetical protein [Clostridiales bacterium]